MQYCLNYSGQSFCPLKITITQFPDEFRLNTFTSLCSYSRDVCQIFARMIPIVVTNI